MTHPYFSSENCNISVAVCILLWTASHDFVESCCTQRKAARSSFGRYWLTNKKGEKKDLFIFSCGKNRPLQSPESPNLAVAHRFTWSAHNHICRAWMVRQSVFNPSNATHHRHRYVVGVDARCCKSIPKCFTQRPFWGIMECFFKQKWAFDTSEAMCQPFHAHGLKKIKIYQCVKKGYIFFVNENLKLLSKNSF